MYQMIIVSENLWLGSNSINLVPNNNEIIINKNLKLNDDILIDILNQFYLKGYKLITSNCYHSVDLNNGTSLSEHVVWRYIMEKINN